PSAISSHNLTIIIAWLSSNFLQLILLPVIIVGQNVQAKAADERAEATFRDTEMLLHGHEQLAQHLARQDQVLRALAGYAAGHPNSDATPGPAPEPGQQQGGAP